MKAILLATAMTLALGSAAVAQDSSSPAASQPSNGQTPGDTSGAPASSMGSQGTSGGATTPDTGASPTPADGSGSAGAPSSGPTGMGAPAGGDTSGGGMSGGASSTPTAGGDYPPCTKGMTDKCVEKGGSGHKMAHHAKKKK